MNGFVSKFIGRQQQSQNDSIRNFLCLNSFQAKLLSLSLLFGSQWTHLGMAVTGVMNYFTHTMFTREMSHFEHKLAAILYLFIPQLGLSWWYSVRYHQESFQRHVDKAVEIGNTFRDTFKESSYVRHLLSAASLCFVPPTICASSVLIFVSGVRMWVTASQLFWNLYFIYVHTSLVLFVIYTSLAGHCFRQMSKQISETTGENTSNDFVVGFVKNCGLLVDACIDINRYFGPQNLSMILFAFSALIIQSFFTIGGHLELFSEVNSFMSNAVLGSYFVILFAIPVFLIVGCANIEHEVIWKRTFQ